MFECMIDKTHFPILEFESSCNILHAVYRHFVSCFENSGFYVVLQDKIFKNLAFSNNWKAQSSST